MTLDNDVVVQRARASTLKLDKFVDARYPALRSAGLVTLPVSR
jgi:hypothetical protein